MFEFGREWIGGLRFGGFCTCHRNPKVIARSLSTLLGTALVISTLSGCRDRRASVDQCADPKLLRVKVGDTVFDLPNTVSSPHALSADETRTDEKLGILRLSYRAHTSDPSNRSDCNSKTQRVADFGDDMGLVFEGDGSEPKDYRLGDRMHAIVEMRRYDKNNNWAGKWEYLANVEDIEKVRFVRRYSIPRKTPTINAEAFVFAYQGRIIKMECQIWDDSKIDGKKDDPRPPYPNQCVPVMRFRAGDILIGVDQRGWRSDAGNRYSLIPPEEWPKQWAFTITKLLSFRVDAKKGVGQ